MLATWTPTEFTSVVVAVTAAITGLATFLTTRGLDAWLKVKADARIDKELEDKQMDEANTLLINEAKAQINELKGQVSTILLELKEVRLQHHECSVQYAEMRGEMNATRGEIGHLRGLLQDHVQKLAIQTSLALSSSGALPVLVPQTTTPPPPIA
jgi:chromosome segregation ATPase